MEAASPRRTTIQARGGAGVAFMVGMMDGKRGGIKCFSVISRVVETGAWRGGRRRGRVGAWKRKRESCCWVPGIWRVRC